MHRSRHDAPHALHRDTHLHRLRRRLRRDGGVRQARLRRGRDGRHAARHPVRARRRAVLGAHDRGRRDAREPARDDPARPPDRTGARRLRLRAPGRLLLRRARRASTHRCSRCCSTRSRRWWRSPRSRSAASGPTLAGFTALGARVRRARAGPRQREAGRARPARAPRSRWPPPSSTPSTSSSSQGIAGRVRPRLLSALVCTGAALTLTRRLGAALGDLRPGEVTAAGWGWLAGLAVVSRRSPRSACSSPA